MTGFEIAQKLRDTQLGRACPSLIAITAWNERSAQVLGKLVGFATITTEALFHRRSARGSRAAYGFWIERIDGLRRLDVRHVPEAGLASGTCAWETPPRPPCSSLPA